MSPSGPTLFVPARAAAPRAPPTGARRRASPCALHPPPHALVLRARRRRQPEVVESGLILEVQHDPKIRVRPPNRPQAAAIHSARQVEDLSRPPQGDEPLAAVGEAAGLALVREADVRLLHA